jgi:hypothetical protein
MSLSGSRYVANPGVVGRYVVAETGAPIAGAVVRYRSLGRTLHDVTDRRGAFTFSPVIKTGIRFMMTPSGVGAELRLDARQKYPIFTSGLSVRNDRVRDATIDAGIIAVPEILLTGEAMQVVGYVRSICNDDGDHGTLLTLYRPEQPDRFARYRVQLDMDVGELDPAGIRIPSEGPPVGLSLAVLREDEPPVAVPVVEARFAAEDAWLSGTIRSEVPPDLGDVEGNLNFSIRMPRGTSRQCQ